MCIYDACVRVALGSRGQQGREGGGRARRKGGLGRGMTIVRGGCSQQVGLHS